MANAGAEEAKRKEERRRVLIKLDIAISKYLNNLISVYQIWNWRSLLRSPHGGTTGAPWSRTKR
jgi:hypothetical protein